MCVRNDALASSTSSLRRGQGCAATCHGSPKTTSTGGAPRAGREWLSAPGSRVPKRLTGTTGAPVTRAR